MSVRNCDIHQCCPMLYILDKCAENVRTGCKNEVYGIFVMFNKIYDDIFDELAKSKHTHECTADTDSSSNSCKQVNEAGFVIFCRRWKGLWNI